MLVFEHNRELQLDTSVKKRAILLLTKTRNMTPSSMSQLLVNKMCIVHQCSYCIAHNHQQLCNHTWISRFNGSETVHASYSGQRKQFIVTTLTVANYSSDYKLL